MAFYNRIKAAKNVPIGTIIPWTGGSGSSSSGTAEAIPHGYKICNSQQTGLRAVDYPMLAQIIGNTYGPFPPTASGFQIGVNYGIVNPYPYNGDPTFGHVDVFNLPDLNQRSLVDIEASRIAPSDFAVIGQYVSKNGIEGTQPADGVESMVSITFDVEPSSTLSGKITGQSITAPSYYDVIYSIPRKLGVDHNPAHIHRPINDNTFNEINTAIPTGTNVMTFMPGAALIPTAPGGFYHSITPVGAFSQDDPADSTLPSGGKAQITWYDPDNESHVLTTTFKNITANNSVIPIPKVRQIPSMMKTEYGYEDGGATTGGTTAVADIQQPADTGPIPPPAQYNGARNYYHSDDIDTNRGGGQGLPTDTSTYDPMTYKTYPTTLNHEAEEWASSLLRGHNHDPYTIEMVRGVRLRDTILINNVNTGSATPLDVDDALNITMNVNTPSLTTIYIMRVF
jgi:hypothetical protein